MRLSIIIALYNAEPYIERCLLSCLDQDIESSEYEVIVVNDGSTDDSMSVVRYYAERHSNISYIEQQNQGPGAARNSGMAVAKGEYLWFVDSDDWIEPNCLGAITRRLFEEDLDALIISAAETDGESRKPPLLDLSSLEGEIYRSSQIVYKMAVDLHPQITIYRRKVLSDNDVIFIPGIYHEDNEFIPRAYYPLQRIAVCSEVVYNIYLSPNSITRSINPKRSYDLLMVSRSLATFAEKVDSSYRRHLYKCIAISLNTSMLCATTYNREDRAKFAEALSGERELFRYFLLSRRLVFALEWVLFTLFPKRSIDIYELFNKLIYRRKGV